MRICVVAFNDSQENSISYRKFDTVEKAVRFYEAMLRRDDVQVISTRRILTSGEKLTNFRNYLNQLNQSRKAT